MSVGVWLALSALTLGAGDAPADARDAYREAAAQAGRDPDAHARLALWCEARGLDAERVKHLGMAVVTQPSHALARGLLGLVQDGGKWRRPEQVVEKNASDPARAALLDEYRAKRAASGDSADAQAKLGAWCEAKGLVAEGQAHYAMALRADPRREDLWKKLGYRKHDGQWRTEAQVAAIKAESKAQEEADRRWTKQLGQWKAMLGQAEGRRREAQDGLATVADPRAVPAILKVFAKDDPATAVRLLGQVDAAAASQSLAMAAVFAKSEEVRRAAAETLAQRDPREFAGVLIGLIRDPIRYEVKRVKGPGSVGELWIEGKKADLRRMYHAPTAPVVPIQANDVVDVDAYGLPLIRRFYEVPIRIPRGMVLPTISTQTPRSISAPDINGFPSFWRPGSEAFVQGLASDPALGAAGPALAAAFANNRPGTTSDLLQRQISAYEAFAPALFARGLPMSAWGTLAPGPVALMESQIAVGQAAVNAQRVAGEMQRQLDADVSQLQAYNSGVSVVNDRVTPILTRASGTDLGPKREAWDTWLTDQLGYALRRHPDYKPTVVQNVTVNTPIPVVTNAVTMYTRASCFAAGTPVWTPDGLRPIEALEVGDLVLSQETTGGVQSYQPVLVVHRNPPSPTLRVAFEGGDSVTASTYHRFWRAGKGWAMARELKPGDVLRTQSGLARVSGVAEEKVQPVYNLDVAAAHSFFVGVQGALVHDNSLPDMRLEPFDRVPEIARNTP